MLKSGIVAALAVAGVVASANAEIIYVDGKAAIFDAGRSVPTLDGILPPVLEVPQGAVSMSANEVVGLVRAHPVLQWGGPDGNYTTINDTDVSSYQSISGVIHPGSLPLLGVFLADGEPEGAAPSRLDFYQIGSNFSSLAPQLGQSFFIGDGWTDGGLLQNFTVPQGATRLFLGLADAPYFTGEPGAYIDNEGGFMADVQFEVVPTPGTLALLGLGGSFVIRRRR